MNNSWSDFVENMYKDDIAFLEDHKDVSIQSEYKRRINSGLWKEQSDDEEDEFNDTKQHISYFTSMALENELKRRDLLPYKNVNKHIEMDYSNVCKSTHRISFISGENYTFIEYFKKFYYEESVEEDNTTYLMVLYERCDEPKEKQEDYGVLYIKLIPIIGENTARDKSLFDRVKRHSYSYGTCGDFKDIFEWKCIDKITNLMNEC